MIGCSNDRTLMTSKLLDDLHDKSVKGNPLRSLLVSAHSSAKDATKLLDRVILTDDK